MSTGLATRPAVSRVTVARVPRFLLTVLGAYAACRLLSAVLLVLVARRQVPTGWNGQGATSVDYLNFTAMWDGQWYQLIATGGYPSAVPVDGQGVVQQNVFAFYPLFPFLSRAVMEVFRVDFFVAGSSVSLLLGFVAAGTMAVLLRDRVGERAALLVVVVWACFPASPTLQVGYTEATAMALLTLYLLALTRERWLWATSVAVLIGLARPIAVPLTAVTLVALVLRWRRRRERPITTREAVSGLTALVGCGLAGFLWPVLAWWRTGRRDAYTVTMSAWRSGKDIVPVQPWVDYARYLFGETWGPVWLTTIFVVIAVMTFGPWASRLGAELRTWSVAYPAYLLVVLDPFTSVFRYLVPLFPLVAVLVGVGGPPTRGWRTPAVVTRAVVLVVAFVIGQWYWLDLLWRFVPPSDYPP